MSKSTRIEVITDGLFARRILNDPELNGVGAVIFDEFHERSLNVDLGLALALESQSVLRPDLRLLVMSATLDTARVADVLACPVVESAGRMFPVETLYLGRTRDPAGQQVARAIERALRQEDGSILAFLPGAADIRRAARDLSNLPPNVSLHPLFGALSPAEQDAAIQPSLAGHRKIVLATDIAESALTIDGVRVIVDAGLSRVPVYDPSGGTSQLQTIRASRASVDQRRGRAGRTQAGVCYRLWDEPELRGLPASIPPEIISADLSGLVLALAEWGERDPSRLTWVDPPPMGRIAAGRAQLEQLGALTSDGVLTPKGRAMAALPMAPRLAALITGTTDKGECALAAEIAALIGERGIGGSSIDVAARLGGLRRDNNQRAKALRRQAQQWGGGATPNGDAGRVLAKGWPDRIAKARDGAAGQYLLASGMAAQVDATDALAKSDWLVVADMMGGGKAARISLAAMISEADVLSVCPPETTEIAHFDMDTQRFRAKRVKSIGAIILSEAPLVRPSGAAAEAALKDAISTHGFDAIGAADMIAETLARIRLLRGSHGGDWPDWTEASVLDMRRDWFDPILNGASVPSPAQTRDALIAALGWPLSQELAQLAPLTIALPSGRRAPVDYMDDNAPLVSARVQELYGIQAHPAIAGGHVPVTLSLLSPGKRPVAVTRDVPGFWSGGYLDMAKDMRGRYPKHDWPDTPATARAHEGRTKKRLQQDD